MRTDERRRHELARISGSLNQRCRCLRVFSLCDLEVILSGPYLEDKLAAVKETTNTKARCTTKQLKERWGVKFTDDSSATVDCGGEISTWKKISKDTWEKQ